MADDYAKWGLTQTNNMIGGEEGPQRDESDFWPQLSALLQSRGIDPNTAFGNYFGPNDVTPGWQVEGGDPKTMYYNVGNIDEAYTWLSQAERDQIKAQSAGGLIPVGIASRLAQSSPYAAGNPSSGLENLMQGLTMAALTYGFGAAGAGMFGAGAGAAGGADSLINLGNMVPDAVDSLGGGLTTNVGDPGMFDDVFDFGNQYNPNAGQFPSGQYNPFNPTGASGMPGLETGLGATGTGLASSITPASLGGSLAGGAAAGATGGGIMDIIQKLFQPGGGSSIAGTGISALLNYFQKSQQQDQLNSAANKVASLNDPMQQTARLPFQAAFADLMFNPKAYQQSPYAVGQQNLANQAFDNTVSKHGPSGTVFNDYLKNFQNIQGQDFFNLANTLGNAGGFNQGAGGGGSAAAGLLGNAATAGNQSYEGFGSLLNNLFKSSGNSTTPSNFDFSKTYDNSVNPFSNATNWSV